MLFNILYVHMAKHIRIIPKSDILRVCVYFHGKTIARTSSMIFADKMIITIDFN